MGAVKGSRAWPNAEHRDLYRFVGAALAAQGIVTVVPDYSIFRPARFPMFVEDAARVVRFARDNVGFPARPHFSHDKRTSSLG